MLSLRHELLTLALKPSFNPSQYDLAMRNAPSRKNLENKGLSDNVPSGGVAFLDQPEPISSRVLPAA
jgi:hypothetical protein